MLPADEGTATLGGESMLGKKVHQVCRMGVGRTFQVVRSFPRLPLLDNVIVGAYGAGLSDHDAIACGRVRAGTASACAARPAIAAGQLTNKQLRLMELARALAGRAATAAAGRDAGRARPRRMRRVLDVLSGCARKA